MFQNTYSSCEIIVIFSYLKFFSKTSEESSPHSNGMMVSVLVTGQTLKDVNNDGEDQKWFYLAIFHNFVTDILSFPLINQPWRR